MVRAILFNQNCSDVAFLIILAPSALLAAILSLLFVQKQPPYAFWIGAIVSSGPSLFSLLLCVLVLKVKLPAPNARLMGAINISGVLALALLVFGVGQVDLNDYWNNKKYSVVTTADPSASVGADSPNVILVSIDSWRADTLLEYADILPNITSLRKKSMWTNSALAVAPSAVPSHLAILTGDDPLKNGTRKADGSYRPNAKINTPTVFRLFHDAGFNTLSLIWDTIKFDKSKVADGVNIHENFAQDHPRLRLLRRDFMPGWLSLLPKKYAEGIALQLFAWRTIDFNSGVKGVVIGNAPGKINLQRALGYLQNLHGSPHPYFMFLHFVDLHQPYRSDLSVRGLMTEKMPWPNEYASLSADHHDIANIIRRDLQLGLPHAVDAAKYLKHIYLEELIYVDSCIGQIISEANKSNRPTYFLITSDHGEHFGEHSQMAHANSLYSETLRVPFIVGGPSIETKRLENVSITDVLPTLVELAGIDAPPDISGNSVFADINEEMHIATSKQEFAIYHQSYKLVVNHGRQLNNPKVWQVVRLCDIKEDPHELTDLSASRPDTVSALLLTARSLLQEH